MVITEKLSQLREVKDEMIRCYGRINFLNNDLESSRRELNAGPWPDLKGKEFGSVIDALGALNAEALAELKGQIAKLVTYIKKGEANSAKTTF